MGWFFGGGFEGGKFVYSAMMKKLIKYIVNKFGYTIQPVKVKKKINLCLVDRLSNHSFDIDLLKFSDNGVGSYEFINKIEVGEYRLVDRDCVCCGSNIYLQLGQSKYGFKWSICRDCGFLQLRTQLDRRALNSFYKSGEYQSLCMGGIDEHSHFLLEKNTMSRIFISVFESLGINFQDKKVLEIGCGSGGIISALSEKGMECAGYDLDRAKIEAGKKFGVKGLFCADAMDSDVDVSKFEFIIISNVLEHLYDPLVFLKELNGKLINNSQKVIIDVPNVDGISHYGEYTSDFFHVSHLWYFSPITLRSMLERSGFNVEYILDRGAAMTLICSASSSQYIETKVAYNTTIFSINYSNRRYL